jgi:hypothetical protein
VDVQIGSQDYQKLQDNLQELHEAIQKADQNTIQNILSEAERETLDHILRIGGDPIITIEDIYSPLGEAYSDFKRKQRRHDELHDVINAALAVYDTASNIYNEE